MDFNKIEGLKNVTVTNNRAEMTFCANCKSCPAIDISKDQFALFMDVVKTGEFDKYL